MNKTTVFICGTQTDVNSLLSAFYGKDVDLCKKKSGAPYLKGVKDYVSVSHKRKCLVVAVSSKPVGVDVEKNEIKPTVFKIADKYFSEKIEQGDYKAFFTLWTKKEAYGKLFEKGISKEILATDLSEDTASCDNVVVAFNSFEFNDYIVTCADCFNDVDFVVDDSAKRIK